MEDDIGAMGRPAELCREWKVEIGVRGGCVGTVRWSEWVAVE